MARGRVWQGIRDWFRPVDRAVQPTTSRPASVGAPSGPIRTREFTRAMLDADSPGADVIPLHSVASVVDDRIDDTELLDFLAADVDPVPADPAFRERLREELSGNPPTEAGTARRQT